VEEGKTAFQVAVWDEMTPEEKKQTLIASGWEPVMEGNHQLWLDPEDETRDDPTTFVGLNNLAAITSDQHNSILVNGRILKSINQWYNKHPSKTNSRKRHFRLENYFHHVFKMIVKNCIRHGR